jgi:hypothetical protein
VCAAQVLHMSPWDKGVQCYFVTLMSHQGLQCLFVSKCMQTAHQSEFVSFTFKEKCMLQLDTSLVKTKACSFFFFFFFFFKFYFCTCLAKQGMQCLFVSNTHVLSRCSVLFFPVNLCTHCTRSKMCLLCVQSGAAAQATMALPVGLFQQQFPVGGNFTLQATGQFVLQHILSNFVLYILHAYLLSVTQAIKKEEKVAKDCRRSQWLQNKRV